MSDLKSQQQATRTKKQGPLVGSLDQRKVPAAKTNTIAGSDSTLVPNEMRSSTVISNPTASNAIQSRNHLKTDMMTPASPETAKASAAINQSDLSQPQSTLVSQNQRYQKYNAQRTIPVAQSVNISSTLGRTGQANHPRRQLKSQSKVRQSHVNMQSMGASNIESTNRSNLNNQVFN